MRFLLPALLLALLTTAVMPGCRTRDFRTEGDVLRARIVEMEREMERLQRRNLELEAEVRRAERVYEGVVPEDVAQQTPRVVEVSFARFSHARDLTGDGFPDELRLYLHTRDGRARFVQAVGEMTVTAMILPVEIDAVPIILGRVTLGPEELRDAYRSGFTGTHYTVTMPVSPTPEMHGLSPADLERVFVRAVFVDGHTGMTHIAERTIDLRQ